MTRDGCVESTVGDLLCDVVPRHVGPVAFTLDGMTYEIDLSTKEQTAVVFASAEQALGFLTSSQAQWDVCSKSEVDANLGFENGRAFVLGNVQSEPNLITVTMASNGGLNGPDACQQALGVLDNVVVEARTCEVPDVTTTYDPVRGWPKDPGWAVPDAERVAKAMLENVTP